MQKSSQHSSEKGIALLIVLAAIMLLSTLVVEFASETQVTYNIALNNKDALEARQLARSAIEITKIVLRFDKEAKQMASSASKRLGRTVTLQPIYKMIPINSEFLRGFAQANTINGSLASTPSATGSPAINPLDKIREGIGADSNAAQDFLNFKGDFDAQITPEEGKIPLNAFFSLSPSQPEYDRLKLVLVQLLLQKTFEPFLPDRIKFPQDLANRIADYIDRNDSVNELGGLERGAEVADYAEGTRPKNGKLLTVEELILVPGMTDDLLAELKKYVTVYSSTAKINLCQSEEELTRAVVLAFAQGAPETVRIDEEEKLKQITDAVKGRCTDVNMLAQFFNETFGYKRAPGGTGATTQPGGAGGPATPNFANLLTTDEIVYRIEATGKVNDSEVKITTVLDTTNRDPTQWKELYWRVE